MKKKCLAPECEKESFCKVLCRSHYECMHKYGRLHLIKRSSGKGYKAPDGYIIIRIKGIAKYEHVLIAEKALGKALPYKAEVHHLNGIKDDNRPENLIICPNHAYHFLIETRTRALLECGNPNHRKCWICKQYDDPSNLTRDKGSSSKHYHKKCRNRLDRERKRKLS